MDKNNTNQISMQEFTDMLKSESTILQLLNSDDKEKLLCASLLACELIKTGDYTPLSFLSRAVKKQKISSLVKQSLDNNCLSKMLQSDNPKYRKNTAKIIGSFGKSEYSQLLCDALKKEQTRMVIPSVLLALGSIGDELAYNTLNSYNVKPASDETEIKHEQEERAALNKALSAFGNTQKHTFTSFENLPVLQLICASKTAKYAANDLKQNNIRVLGYSDTIVNISGDKSEKIYSVRSFRELLIPIAKAGEDCSIKDRIIEVLDKTHENNGKPFRYRIEYIGTDDRTGIISEYARMLDCGRLVNSVSDYEVEVRVYKDRSVKLKLYTYEDNRFSYRKEKLPASIHPANAASVISFAKQYLKKDAVVLDMCCGSGTMLFERELALPAKRLMGVDITENAIDCAKKNAKAFDKKFLFYHSDCRRFTLREPVDEIISNLPFGNRVGNHENNERLYHSIFTNMQYWLKPGGAAILYTMEFKLIKEQLRRFDCFELADVLKTEAGGLMPVVCVLVKTR